MLDKYNKDSKAKAIGTFMRTFARSKTSDMITTWNDPNYFTVRNAYFNFLADATSLVDALTVPDPGALVLFNLLWELYFKNANLKDLVAADETSWILYTCVYLTIMLETQIQYNCRCYLPAYTESDIVPGDYTNISYFEQSSWDIFLASMAQYPMPKGCDIITKLFTGWVLQIAPEYERYTLRIPPAIFQPYNTRYDLADLEAMRDILRVNLGGFTTHAKKYGLGTGTWSDPVKPTVKTFGDPDVTAWLCHSRFTFYDNTPAHAQAWPEGGFLGANLLADYTNVEYFFKDTPNESPIHVLAPWNGTYDATNNPYGGFIVSGPADAVEYDVNFMSCAQHGTAMANHAYGDRSSGAVIANMKVTFDGQAAAFRVYANGTNFTAAQQLATGWQYASHYNLFMGEGRGATETNNDLLNYLGKLLV